MYHYFGGKEDRLAAAGGHRQPVTRPCPQAAGGRRPPGRGPLWALRRADAALFGGPHNLGALTSSPRSPPPASPASTSPAPPSRPPTPRFSPPPPPCRPRSSPCAPTSSSPSSRASSSPTAPPRPSPRPRLRTPAPAHRGHPGGPPAGDPRGAGRPRRRQPTATETAPRSPWPGYAGPVESVKRHCARSACSGCRAGRAALRSPRRHRLGDPAIRPRPARQPAPRTSAPPRNSTVNHWKTSARPPGRTPPPAGQARLTVMKRP